MTQPHFLVLKPRFRLYDFLPSGDKVVEIGSRLLTSYTGVFSSESVPEDEEERIRVMLCKHIHRHGDGGIRSAECEYTRKEAQGS